MGNRKQPRGGCSMGNRKKQRRLEHRKENKRGIGGCSMGNRKKQRWLYHEKQKAAEVAVAGETERSREVAVAWETESSRGGLSRGNRRQQRGL